MKTTKQKIGLFFKILLVVICLIVGAFFVFRDAVLQQTLDKISNEMTVEYNSSFTVENASFDGLSDLSMNGITLVPQDADTLVKIEKIKTTVNLLKLISGEVQLGTLDIQNGYIQLVKKGKKRNFDAFLKKDPSAEKTNEKRDYAKFAYALITKILNLVPTDMVLDNLAFKIDDNGNKTNINFQKLRLANKQLETSIKVQTNTISQQWKLKGFADPRNKKADIQFANKDTGAIKLPYFDERFNLKTSFNTIRLNLENIEKDGDELHIDGFMAIANLKINHPKIANKDVVLQNAKFDYRFLLGSDFVSIDSTSTVQLNKIKFHPYLAYDTALDTLYKLKVNIPKMKAQDFITSLPEGLFTHFKGMEASGTFSYKLDFAFNQNKPNRLVFDSTLKKENLKITKYGDANLTKLNGEFVYRALINNVLQRPVLVGTANPNYTPLDQISPYLQKSVLTTEDPSFFSHRGFISEAFKQSIVKNIRTKKFARGASTISMQLVKNAFLSREKTLSRKLEEILLVYILENNRIVSKERMLEVYFNIIEWGPNVYGIGEASQFYFQKIPAELSLNECLYLARIIPSPKKFMYQFNDQGLLKDFATKQELFLTKIMLRRGLFTPEDTLYTSTPIYISGPARSFIKFKVLDSTLIKVDSLAEESEFDF
ncbi:MULTISPECIES: transglycosylase domain-containing protein [unclassified Flavobacterium]|uniref:transglycosylase domain-containing protein n=1 Tax=unclassified Flavobacterium TaxID=196869 RepID=UPI00131BC67A|nr:MULTISPECIES: biosynthetic peptidoglycan transglycosylase [unclassified Flavobacterium]